MADKPKTPPGFSGFKDLLKKLVGVPKAEIDEKERQYRAERESQQRPKKRA